MNKYPVEQEDLATHPNGDSHSVEDSRDSTMAHHQKWGSTDLIQCILYAFGVTKEDSHTKHWLWQDVFTERRDMVILASIGCTGLPLPTSPFQSWCRQRPGFLPQVTNTLVGMGRCHVMHMLKQCTEVHSINREALSPNKEEMGPSDALHMASIQMTVPSPVQWWAITKKGDWSHNGFFPKSPMNILVQVFVCTKIFNFLSIYQLELHGHMLSVYLTP